MDQLLAIRTFARVVEAGSFTKAADSIQMPKATVTKLVQALEKHVAPADQDPETMGRFLAQLFYVPLDATAPDADWSRLDAILDPSRVRVFYLATSPDLYGPVCKALAAHGQEPLVITEMLPAIEDTWLTDVEGSSYTCELRMAALPWRGPTAEEQVPEPARRPRRQQVPQAPRPA